MSIEKKLGIWGVDRIVRKDNKIYAEDYYCVRCYKEKKEAVADKFWPNVDIDIKSFPYCKSCIDYLDLNLMIELFEG